MHNNRFNLSRRFVTVCAARFRSLDAQTRANSASQVKRMFEGRRLRVAKKEVDSCKLE